MLLLFLGFLKYPSNMGDLDTAADIYIYANNNNNNKDSVFDLVTEGNYLKLLDSDEGKSKFKKIGYNNNLC